MASQISDYPADRLTFSWAFDLYNAGSHPEDGTSLDGHSYYIIAETPAGRRFSRDMGCVGYGFEDEHCYIDGDNDEMKAKCETLTNNLTTKYSPKLNPDVWFEIDPTYGSIAYQNLDNTGYFLQREMKEANNI